MMDYGRRMLKAMQPAFSRRAAFAWFGAGGNLRLGIASVPPAEI